MNVRALVALWLLALVLTLPAAAAAQSEEPPADLVVLQTVADEMNGQTRLRTYFVLRDRNGAPITRDDVREGAYELDGVASPTTVDEPADPMKIALVIDASGSMNNSAGGATLSDEVRAAAQRMIDIAPANAEFAVFSFAEWVRQENPGFLRKSDQADLIKDAIAGFKINPAGQGDTCLYDAASQAIDALVAAQPAPSERLSVILFTDGKDRQAGGAACSNLGAPEVIRKALEARGAPIPIYTIGVCMEEANAGDPCANVSRDELNVLAEKTRAFPVIGPRSDLDSLFTRLMEGLRSQWVAETTLCADAGDHVALLSIKLDDKRISEDVPFSAARTCLPPTSVDVRLQFYVPETDSYTVTLDLVSPQRIDKLNVGVYAYAEGGAQLATPLTFEQPPEQLTFTLPTAGMVSGSEYFLRISALDSAGQPVRNAAGSLVLANSKFSYQSKLSFSILGVEPDWAQELLVVTVKTLGVGERPVQFSGELRDPKTGQSESLLPVMYQGGKLSFPLPRILCAAGEPRDYELVLETDNNGEPLRQSYQRQLAPCPRTDGVAPITWLLYGLGSTAVCTAIIAAVMLRRRPPEVKIVAPPPGGTVFQPPAPAGRPASPPSPPSDVTEMAHEGTALARQLWLRVITTPSPGTTLERTISSFPFVIGRSQGGLTLPHDTKVSGQHLRLEEAGGGFSLTDLNSSNGTWVGERQLARGETVAFDGRVVVRLGPDTTLELQPA